MRYNKLKIGESGYSFAEYYPSNNDGSIKKIAVHFKGEKDKVFDGEGGIFRFHDGVSPIVIDGCENITLKNFSVDYLYPQHLEADVIFADENSFVLKIAKEFSARVQDNVLVVSSGEEETFHNVLFCQEFDPQTKAPYAGSDHMFICCSKDGGEETGAQEWMIPMHLKELDKGEILFRHTEESGAKLQVHKGGRLLFGLKDRKDSAIFITDSKNIRLENINIYRSPSMGVIAQLSENIYLDGVNVIVKEDRKELLSSNADATHFVNCRGGIKIENSKFYNMLDDAANIHGIYGKVVSVEGNVAKIRLMHHQQKGVCFIRNGDEVRFFSSEDFEEKCTMTVQRSEITEDKEYILLSCGGALTNVEVDDVVDNITAMPSVEIRNCQTGNNRPRGFLLTSGKRMLVENCLFENSACGIHVTSDAKNWYESGKVNELIIRNNHFKGCNYAWGTAAIMVDPSCDMDNVYVHRNIVVEGNLFETYGYGFIYAKCVDGISINGNEVKKIYSDRVPACNFPTMKFDNCKNVEIN